jgi:two-component system response regulator YesN
MNRNLLIVDDEWEILTWLEEMFIYDFDREIGVYKANSALEALELLGRVKIDVVLTDIRMPAMDGITLFHRVKENWPRCRVVFLTGYRDFDKLYELIQHKDIQYILKSENDEAIQSAVRKAFDEIELELKQTEIQKRQERKLEIARYWLRKEFLDMLLTGDLSQNKEKFNEAEISLQELNIQLNLEEDMLVFLFRIDASDHDIPAHERSALSEELAAILLENIPDKVMACSHVMEGRHVYLIVQPGEKKILTITLGGIEYAQEVFRNIHNRTFSAIYASHPVSYSELPEIVNRLRRTLVSFVGRNNEMILMMDSSDYQMPIISHYDLVAKAPRLKAFLELHRQEDFFELLSSMTKQLEGKSQHNPIALELYYSISLQLLQFINENSLYEEISLYIDLYKLTKADEHASWVEAAQYLFDVSDMLFTLLRDNEATLSERALTRVIDYIDKNLSEDLSLAVLADVGGFNASYLSRLFRQVTNVTITEYITKKRIDMAKKLLENTTEKVRDIALKCGYTSSHSFARAFRKTVGMSPTEYREAFCGRS